MSDFYVFYLLKFYSAQHYTALRLLVFSPITSGMEVVVNCDISMQI